MSQFNASDMIDKKLSLSSRRDTSGGIAWLSTGFELLSSCLLISDG
jgi:hypothetical protein